MPLHPAARALLDEFEAAGRPAINEQTAAEAREGFLAMARFAGDPEPVAGVKDLTVSGPGGDIPIRVYYPEGAAPHPALIFYHGGGWVIGDLETHDTVCRGQCNAIGSVVIAVDYRLAPEHQYPAAAEDAYAVAQWVSGNAPGIDVDASRIAVGGDSAGGNLTAVVALMARDRGGPALCAQVPIYPVTDYDFGTTSYRDNADGYLLTKDAMVWFWDHYLPMPGAGKEAYASPLRADDLSGLPPALVITAEFDPLRDEGEAYAQRLSEAGVATTLHRYDGMVHGFYQLGAAIPTAHEAAEETAAFLKAAFKL